MLPMDPASRMLSGPGRPLVLTAFTIASVPTSPQSRFGRLTGGGLRHSWGMFETEAELAELQSLLDASLSRSTAHLQSIIKPGERTLSARQLVRP